MNDYDEFLSLSKLEQENYLTLGMRGLGKTMIWMRWINGLLELHPEFTAMYIKLVNKWAETVESHNKIPESGN